ncbi:ATP-binding protein [Psychromonas aquimarina]|uniref:ATP-binding protein n=1 Tax=Psychromonas aquimarina TaxID=444919 RepID=UPI0003FCFB53|nr:ATP-binding protein [Psychromonas aquimarina]
MIKIKYFKKLKNTLMVAFLVLSITPLTLSSLFYLYTQSQDLSEQIKTHLITQRDNQQQQIESYFKALESEVRSFARSELGISSGGRFYGLVKAFQHLGNTPQEAQTHAQRRYEPGSGDIINSKIKRDSPEYLGSERYRLIHKRYHYLYSDLLARSDFSDILLVNLKGTIVYSTRKFDYYGTNLLKGKYKDSPLADTFKTVSQHVKTKPNEKITPVIFSDFKKQGTEEPAWFAAPIKEQGYLHSFVIFKLDNSRLSSLLAKSSGHQLRTLLTDDNSRSRINLPQEQAASLQTDSIQQAINGFTSVDSFSNSQGEQVLAAFTPISVLGKSWALAIELPEKLAYARVEQLEQVFIITLLLAIALVVIASHYLSNSITAPILNLAWIAERLAAGDLEQKMTGTERQDEIGRLAVSFARMKHSVSEKLQLIHKQNKELETNLALIQQQNNELQLSDKLKDEFLATTSHELRTPLHGMLGITEMLSSGAYGPLNKDQQYQLDIINNSGMRLSHLVDDLLDYHKMRYGNLYINKHALDLSSAVHLVLELSSHLLDNKPLRIINQIPEHLPQIVADEQRLEQVLYNLIGNAIKYTSEGKIIICANVIEDNLQVQVIDTGSGIEAAQLEHIFEPLTQANVDSPYYRQGAGLGLSISRRLIELMGGSLYVSSQPQIGTTFSFTLPLASAAEVSETNLSGPVKHFNIPAPSEQISVTTDSLPDNPNAPLLIVADDEAVNLQVLTSFLRLEGYRIKTALNGAETLELIEQEIPALLLLDVMMPGMSGYEVCQALRKEFDAGSLPIIMLTALSQSKDRIRGFEAGANDYVCKPFNQKELAARINAHLQASQTQRLNNSNIQLRQSLKNQEQIEAGLLETQGNLLTLLEHSPDAVLCIRNDERIHFANRNAGKLFKRSLQQLQHYQLDELVVKRSLENNNKHNHEIDIYIEGKIQRLTASVIPLPEQSGLHSLIIICIDNNYDAQRVTNLENAVETLSNYAFDGDSRQLQSLKELGGEFTRLVDKVEGKGADKNQLKREVLVDVMNRTLEYWELENSQTKFELAEQSRLWRVYLDRSTLQTRTLDKYLHLETLPKAPRWRTVLSTIEYVLANCDVHNQQRLKIEQLRSQLQKLIS